MLYLFTPPVFQTLIGDDINGACKAATEQTGTPIIPVDSPGFLGHYNLGISNAGEALLEHVIGTDEPEFTTPYDINLIGEYNVAGATWNVLPLLTKLGIRVLSKITGDASYKEICYAHRAKLNVIISAKPLVKMAKKMEERFNIPYIEESFCGMEDISRCLLNIAAKLGDSDLQQRTEKLIAEETAALDQQLAPYINRLQGKRVVILSESLKSWAMISAAKNLKMEVSIISAKKIRKEDRARIKNLLGEDAIILEYQSPRDIIQLINEYQADILIASDRYQSTALKAQIPLLDINQELYHSYAGYRGIVAVSQELYTSLYSPIWEQVRKSAPWD